MPIIHIHPSCADPEQRLAALQALCAAFLAHRTGPVPPSAPPPAGPRGRR